MDAERGSGKMAGKFETPRGQAATDAKRKYNEKSYDRLYPMVHKGKKETYEWIETTLDRAAGAAPESRA